jgi:hypothetical protein
MLSFPAIALSLLVFAGVARAEDVKGTWTIRASDEAGQVYFGLAHHMHGGHSQDESDWPVGEFLGLDLTTTERHDVKFAIARDAGRFECDGFVKDGEGAGVFHFTPNPAFAQDMARLGFTGIDDEKQLAMAVHDVSIEFAREMKGRNLNGLDTDKLIAFRIFRITENFIRELRAEGLPARDADKLIAFRVHGVTPAMVHATRSAGLEPDEDQLIAMRIHGVSPEYIASLKSRGMKDLTIDQLVSLRIHGIE